MPSPSASAPPNSQARLPEVRLLQVTHSLHNLQNLPRSLPRSPSMCGWRGIPLAGQPFPTLFSNTPAPPPPARLSLWSPPSPGPACLQNKPSPACLAPAVPPSKTNTNASFSLPLTCVTTFFLREGVVAGVLLRVFPRP